ncbi:hypothetical protein AN958_07992 [Leucoagaricus sp. SymC.cos]|nr:hypothetical protein AN958_07992 [Leucoagaricus sp. SymC.cos]
MAASVIAKFGADLTADNYYGSPSPPWQPGSKPGWYYGPHPEKSPGLPCLTPDNCKWLAQYPQAIHCPNNYPPPSPPTLPHYPPPPPPRHSYPLPSPTTKGHTTKSTSTKTSHITQPPYTIAPPNPPISTSSSVHIPPVYTTTEQPPQTTPTPTYIPPPPPPPPGGYYPTFYNITAAVQADDYMTFGLVESVEGKFCSMTLTN